MGKKEKRKNGGGERRERSKKLVWITKKKISLKIWKYNSEQITCYITEKHMNLYFFQNKYLTCTIKIIECTPQ